MALTIYPECVLPASWHINGPTASAYPLAGAVSLAGAAPFTFHHTGRKLSSESNSAISTQRIFGDGQMLLVHWRYGDLTNLSPAIRVGLENREVIPSLCRQKGLDPYEATELGRR